MTASKVQEGQPTKGARGELVTIQVHRRGWRATATCEKLQLLPRQSLQNCPGRYHPGGGGTMPGGLPAGQKPMGCRGAGSKLSWKAFWADSGRSFQSPARTAATLPPEGPCWPFVPFPSPLPGLLPPVVSHTARGLYSVLPSLLACCFLSCRCHCRPQTEQCVSSPDSTWRCQAQLYPQAQESHLRVRVMPGGTETFCSEQVGNPTCR